MGRVNTTGRMLAWGLGWTLGAVAGGAGQCSDDRWLTTRVDGLSGHDEKLRLIALDTSKRT